MKDKPQNSKQEVKNCEFIKSRLQRFQSSLVVVSNIYFGDQDSKIFATHDFKYTYQYMCCIWYLETGDAGRDMEWSWQTTDLVTVNVSKL